MTPEREAVGGPEIPDLDRRVGAAGRKDILVVVKANDPVRVPGKSLDLLRKKRSARVPSTTNKK